MFRTDGKTITVSRGDTGTVTFTFSTAPASGQVLIFSISEKPGREPLVEKSLTTDGTATQVFTMASADTGFRPGTYYWDVRLAGAGSLLTYVEPLKFEILPVVGDGEVSA